MNRLRELFHRVASQLGVLSTSQRLVIGLCAALVGVSVLWLLNWSATPLMIPVLEQDFRYEELALAEEALRRQGIPFKTVGRRILTRPQDQDNAIRILHENDATPQDGRIDLDALIKMSNPFTPESDRLHARTVAKGNKLAKIISSSPHVQSAEVILNADMKRRIGAPPDVPSATVVVTLKPGHDMTRKMVEGFANMVSQAVSGLEPHRVAIVEGRTFQYYSVPHPDDTVNSDFLDEKQRHEANLLAKIMDSLRYIPGVLISVNLDMDWSRTRTERQQFDKPQIKSDQTRSEETTTPRVASEVGVNPNTSAGLTTPLAGASSVIKESTAEFHEGRLTEKIVIDHNVPTIHRVTASIKVPRSWVVRVYQQTFPDQPDPTDDQLKDVIDLQRATIQTGVATILQAVKDDIQVDVYPDLGMEDWPVLAGAPGWAGTEGAESNDVMALLKTHGPQVGLGVLALLSLFLMLRVGRRSADWVDSTLPGGGRSARGAGLFESDSSMETAEYSDQALEGKEMSDPDVRYHKLTRQVSDMVEKDPRGAAELLRNWIEGST